MGTEILYGFHPVMEAMQADRREVYQVCLAKPKSVLKTAQIERLAAEKHIPVKRISGSDLCSLTGTESHQSICAKCSSYACKGLEEILPKTINDDTCLLLLDRVVDPHNLGALIRTAYCAGLDGVVIPKDRSAQPTPAVSKASAGALEHVDLARITNMITSIKILKRRGFWVSGLDRFAGTDIFRSDLSGPLAIIVGGEEKGIRPLVKKHCDRLVAIPQAKEIDSLNASVAGGIVIYEAIRQRKYNH